MSAKVRIVHPNHPGVVAKVSWGAYERRSKGLGWRLADDPAQVTESHIAEAWNSAAAPSEDALNAELDEKDQLRQLLTDRGVTGWDGRTGIKKLRQLVGENG